MSFVYVLIPLMPLLASIVVGLAGARLGERSSKVGVVAVGLSFALSVAAFVQVVLQQAPIVVHLYEFLHCGTLTVKLGLYLDQLAVLLLLLVTGVSFVVHVYSAGYMVGDARYSRFFAVMTLFTFGMITLVTSSNLLMMFMCWEVMGICSYLLICHQADRKAACSAATKAFLVNAVADVGLLFGIVLTFATFGTLDVQQILSQAASVSEQTINLLDFLGLEWHVRTVTFITLMLFIGCLGKSAQVPFHIWLPHAMEAPTPVSALIHAATMVNAGPYLLVRFSGLVKLSPVAMTVIAVVGAVTALFAAMVALTQSDIKKILAYSTISQIGFMIMTCGLGAFAVAIFHMLAHGFLKGFLFLSTGNQLAATGGHSHGATQRPAKPPLILSGAALSLACVPPLLIFSGPYESLWTAHNSSVARISFWAIGLLTVFFTAMYLYRGIIAWFLPTPSALLQPRLTSPLHLASILTGALGLIGILLVVWQWFVPFLAPATTTPFELAGDGWRAWDLPRFVWPLVAVVAGWGLAMLLHVKPLLSFLPRSRVAESAYVLFLNKFYFDEIYSVYLVRPVLRLATWLWRVVDMRGIDFAIVGGGLQSVGLARWLWRRIDVRVIDRAVVETGGQSVGLAQWLLEAIDVRRIVKGSDRIGRAADASGKKLNDVEPRTIQHHLVVLIAWLVLAILFFYWLVL